MSLWIDWLGAQRGFQSRCEDTTLIWYHHHYYTLVTIVLSQNPSPHLL